MLDIIKLSGIGKCVHNNMGFKCCTAAGIVTKYLKLTAHDYELMNMTIVKIKLSSINKFNHAVYFENVT